jgi:hypothetical protein
MADGACAVDGQRDVAGMLHLGDFVGVAHNPIDLVTEPDVYRFIHESTGYQCQQHRRNQ